MYSRETEIRHIASADVFKLGQILDQTNAWKKLMRIIPKNLSDKLEDNNLKKYNNDHIRLIENASVKQNRMSTEILFEEWGTMGRKRPTVGNLLELLIKAELFRAADFVALSFLNEPPPERPLKGPAAKIDISLPLLSEDVNEIEKILDDTNYPGTKTLLENAQVPSEMNNKDFYEKVTFDDKKLMEINKTTTTTIQSDLIKFSSDSIGNTANITENNIPILSELVHNNDSNTTKTSTQLIEFSSTSSAISQLSQNQMISSNQISETNIDDDEFESKDIPILSVLQTQHKNYIDDDDGGDDDDDDGNDRNNDDDDDDDDGDDDDVDDELRHDLLSNDSTMGVDSSLTNVTETSDDSSFSCDGGIKQSTTECIQSDSNIPCISALNN